MEASRLDAGFPIAQNPVTKKDMNMKYTNPVSSVWRWTAVMAVCYVFLFFLFSCDSGCMRVNYVIPGAKELMNTQGDY